MLRITKESDYGFLLLVELASDPDGKPYNAKDLAGATQLSAPMVSKILKLLAKGGLLTSHRGVKGGYALGRSPESITAADVVLALEGPIGMTDCTHLEGEHRCRVESRCRVRMVWHRINTRILTVLEQVTLAEMMGSPESIGFEFSRTAHPAAIALSASYQERGVGDHDTTR